MYILQHAKYYILKEYYYIQNQPSSTTKPSLYQKLLPQNQTNLFSHIASLPDRRCYQTCFPEI